MANYYSIQEVVADGSMTEIPVSFVYTDPTTIEVYLDLILTTAWSWKDSNKTIVALDTAPANGVVVQIRRNTPLTTPTYVFGYRGDGSGNATFSADSVDANFIQTVMVAQEATDKSVESKDLASEANLTARAADGKADGAVGVANSAYGIATGIDGKATQALQDAFDATQTANAAHGIATGIDAKATQALATANIADGNADAAVITANAIDGKATSALLTAGIADGKADDAVQDATIALNTAVSIDGKATTALSQSQDALDAIGGLGSAADADIVQTTGSSTTDVMSQKAVSDEFDLLGSAALVDTGSAAGQVPTNAVLGTAAYADIVGAMASGAIIERGSNANGEYVKFADGTQLAVTITKDPGDGQVDGPIYRSIDIHFDLPATFVSGTVIPGMVYRAGGYGVWATTVVGQITQAATSVPLVLLAATAGAIANVQTRTHLRAVVIGRWK